MGRICTLLLIHQRDGSDVVVVFAVVVFLSPCMELHSTLRSVNEGEPVYSTALCM